MALRTITSETLKSIADAIRAKTGKTAKLTPSQMATEIGTISGGGSTPSGTISISTNGTYNVAQYASALVNVAGGGSGLEFETGTVTVESEGDRCVINHSLNSTKIIGFVVPIAGETYASVGTTPNVAGYKTYSTVFGNLAEAVNGSFNLDLSSYHSALGNQSVDFLQTLKIPSSAVYTGTPWTTHSSVDETNNIHYAVNKSEVWFELNKITLAGGRTWMKGTFRYLLIKFG